MRVYVCVGTGFACAYVKRDREKERAGAREKGHRAERGTPKHSLDSTRAAESIHQPSPVRSLRPQNQSAERTNTYRPAPNAHPLSLSVSFSFSSGFHTVPSTFPLSFSLFLSRDAKPSTNLVTRTPGFKNARLSAPYARASLVFLFPWLRFSFALSAHRNSFEEFSRLASPYT